MRKMVIMGSIGVAAIIVLAMLSSVVTAQAIPTKDESMIISKLKSDKTRERINVVRQMIKNKEVNQLPGEFINYIISFIILIFLYLFSWLIWGTPPGTS